MNSTLNVPSYGVFFGAGYGAFRYTLKKQRSIIPEVAGRGGWPNLREFVGGGYSPAVWITYLRKHREIHGHILAYDATTGQWKYPAEMVFATADDCDALQRGVSDGELGYTGFNYMYPDNEVSL